MSAVCIQDTWQAIFVAMLPELERRLGSAFRHLVPTTREEMVAEAVALCVVAFARLHERGRMHDASASTLAWYSTRQVKQGRLAAGHMNRREPLSRYAQVRGGMRADGDAWIEDLVDSKRWSPADQAAVRLDVRDWLITLSTRLRRIASDLAAGFATHEVAKKHGLSSSRISQLRRELYDRWRSFQGEVTPAV